MTYRIQQLRRQLDTYRAALDSHRRRASWYPGHRGDCSVALIPRLEAEVERLEARLTAEEAKFPSALVL